MAPDVVIADTRKGASAGSDGERRAGEPRDGPHEARSGTSPSSRSYPFIPDIFSAGSLVILNAFPEPVAVAFRIPLGIFSRAFGIMG